MHLQHAFPPPRPHGVPDLGAIARLAPNIHIRHSKPSNLLLHGLHSCIWMLSTCRWPTAGEARLCTPAESTLRPCIPARPLWLIRSPSSRVFNAHSKRCCRRVTMATRSAAPGRSGGPEAVVFGLGYTGTAVASYLAQHGWSVTGTMRDGSKAGKLPSGVQSVLFDSNKSQAMDSELISRLATARCVVSTVPPGDGDASQEGSVWRDPVVQSIDAAARSESRVLQEGALLVYLSSTGVYGDHEGAWVTEDSPCLAKDDKALARLRCEADWLRLGREQGARALVLRLGGIYGPGRSALDTAQASADRGDRPGDGVPTASASPAVAPGTRQRRLSQRYTARVHVGDVSRTVLVAASDGGCEGIVNVVDCDPTSHKDVVAYARRMLGMAGDDAGDVAVGERGGDPGCTSQHNVVGEGAEHGPGRGDVPAVRPRGEKRVSNAALLRLLAAHGGLQYPTYREGLKAILRGESFPFGAL